MATARDKHGRFSKAKGTKGNKQLEIDHNYCGVSNTCNGADCSNQNCTSYFHLELPKSVSKTSWRDGRRIVGFGFLLDNLQNCTECRLGPVPLTRDSVVGELRKGLGGFLYVRCQNIDCGKVNRAPYGKHTGLNRRACRVSLQTQSLV